MRILFRYRCPLMVKLARNRKSKKGIEEHDSDLYEINTKVHSSLETFYTILTSLLSINRFMESELGYIEYQAHDNITKLLKIWDTGLHDIYSALIYQS